MSAEPEQNAPGSKLFIPAARLLPGAAIFGLLWTLSLPLYVDLAVAALLVWIVIRANFPEICVVLGSLIVSIVCLEPVARYVLSLDPPYYREHEKYAFGDHYRPRITDVISMPYGDIFAADPSLPDLIKEARTVHFHTDSLGFRNAHEYSGERFVLAGDSFVVGNGTDWEETLPAVLERSYNLPVYSISYPGEPKDYEARSSWFLDHVSKDVRFAFFIFEGNDFERVKGAVIPDGGEKGPPLLPPGLADLLNRYDAWRGLFLIQQLPSLKYPALIFNRSRRTERRYLFQREASSAHLAKIGDKLVAAFRFQTARSLEASRTLVLPPNESVQSRLSCVFFIPTKARVYSDEFGFAMPEPSASFAAIQRYFSGTGVAVVDLTPALRAEAKRLLSNGEYVFWRDDSHWNGNGIRAVAPVVAGCLNGNR